MKNKIEKLTPAQKILLEERREDYRAMALANPPVSEERLIEIVKRLYQVNGLEEPQVFVHDNPQDCLEHRSEILRLDYLEHQFLHMPGGPDYYWLSVYLFAREVGVEYPAELNEKLDAYTDYATYCGPLYAYESHAFVSRRPEYNKFDNDLLLHCEDGPAIHFKGDFNVYAWHGTRIPADWIEDKDNLTAETVLTWENLEQRRAGCEIIGWDKILDASDVKVIDDSDPDPTHGRLVEIDLPDAGRTRFLDVQCGTGRRFALCVDPNSATIKEAHAGIVGIPVELFQFPTVRT